MIVAVNQDLKTTRNKPGIDLDEVQRDLVLALLHGECFLDVVRLGLGAVTTANVVKRAAVEALEVFDILEVDSYRRKSGNFVNATLSIPQLSSFAVCGRSQLGVNPHRQFAFQRGRLTRRLDSFLIPAAAQLLV